jgi:hypothetical protein
VSCLQELNFYSISSDGRVANWIMSKNELKMEPVMQLKLVSTVKVRITTDKIRRSCSDSTQTTTRPDRHDPTEWAMQHV